MSGLTSQIRKKFSLEAVNKIEQERLDNTIAEILDDRTLQSPVLKVDVSQNDQVSSKPVILSRVWAKDLPGCLRLACT
jgi:hypothetical protein